MTGDTSTQPVKIGSRFMVERADGNWYEAEILETRDVNTVKDGQTISSTEYYVHYQKPFKYYKCQKFSKTSKILKIFLRIFHILNLKNADYRGPQNI